MNISFKFDLNAKTVLPMLHKAQPYIVGVILIAVFGYTAYIVNAALNVAPILPAASSQAAPTTFDQPTINSLKNLNQVQGTLPTGNVGQNNPF
jgi:hypothetical protein